MPEPPSAGPASERDPPPKPPASGGFTLGLGGLLIELLLPATLSAALLIVLAGYTPYWDLRTRLGLAIFGLLLVALSLVFSLRLDSWTLARRRRRGSKQVRGRVHAYLRLAKVILGGVVIPIAALAAANLVQLPNHQTPMSMAIGLSRSRPQLSHEEQLGNAVRRAESPGAKVQGIRALQAVGSGEALEQLFRLLRDDPAALKRGSESQALSTALASYGVRAKAGLLQRLSEANPGPRRDAAAPPGDLFDRYFSADFEALRREIDRRLPEAAAETAGQGRLELAQADLKRALSQVEADAGLARDDSSVPGFVMRTFLQMSLKDDAELLAFARKTAGDVEWSDPVRGQALLLIAKLGEKDDLDRLYGYLEDPSPLLQARAMQAIAELQARLAAR